MLFYYGGPSQLETFDPHPGTKISHESTKAINTAAKDIQIADNLPLVAAQMLTDPWGRPIAYDPSGPRNKRAKPDVWSLGPDGKPGQEIGNWMPIPN